MRAAKRLLSATARTYLDSLGVANAEVDNV
jgi:hypothetical protein